MNAPLPPSDSSHFMLPVKGWFRRHERPAQSILLLAIGALSAIAGLLGFMRNVAEFRRLDFTAMPVPSGFMIVSVTARSGAARAGLAWGDTVVAVEGVPANQLGDLEETLYRRRISLLSLMRGSALREVHYYPPSPQIDVRYLLVAFAAMFTLVVAGLVFLGHPTAHAGRFFALAEALFAAIVIPGLQEGDALGQLLLLLRDFGRLALPPLLVTFFATFPFRTLGSGWLSLAFLPSLTVALGRTGLSMGVLRPVVGDVLLPEALDAATALLAILGVVTAAGLGFRAFLASRHDPTRRRQVEWVALGAAAGFAPYLLLSLIPALAGADLEVLSWISLLPLALVPLGVASSLLEFRLWDLEDITRQVVATGIAVLLGGICFALLNLGITQAGYQLGNWRNLVAVAGGVLLVALAVPARRLLLEGFERFQYRERLAARRALTAFAEQAVAHRDPVELLGRLAKLLQEALAVDQVVTYFAAGAQLSPAPPSSALPTRKVDSVRGAYPSEEERALHERGLWHRFVMECEGRVVGVVYCGLRQGELPLGHGERRLVAALAAQAALALENTLLLTDLRRQVEEHRLLEGYLERVFQFSAVALLICDSRGRVLRANQRAGTLLDRAPGALVGESLASLVELPEEWRASLPAGLAGVQIRLAVGGERRTGLLSTSALEDEPGSFDGRVVALDDISEQLRLEQRLAQQERLAALGRLAAGLAHEVNTPVTGIASYSQLLRELTPPGDPRSPLLAKLEEQSFRVARIVSNLLELARPSGIERQSVDLAAVARDELVQMRSDGARLGVEIDCHMLGDATVSGNRVQLELVVHNLLRNAIQATPAGGRVELSIVRENGKVVLEVSDSGPGMPAELAGRVFEPFVTTREGRGGTGLGLSISRDIIVAHGGAISVARTSPAGTVLRVELDAVGRSE
ncbi:MAG: ATP-binding protein [Acidobacteriota bacterium]